MRKKMIIMFMVMCFALPGCSKKDAEMAPTQTCTEETSSLPETTEDDFVQENQTSESQVPEADTSDERNTFATIQDIYEANAITDILGKQKKIVTESEYYNQKDELCYKLRSEFSLESGHTFVRSKIESGEKVTQYELTDVNGSHILQNGTDTDAVITILSKHQFEDVLQDEFLSYEEDTVDKKTLIQDGVLLLEVEVPSEQGKTGISYYINPDDNKILATIYNLYDIEGDYTGYIVKRYTYGDDCEMKNQDIIDELPTDNGCTVNVIYNPDTEEEESAVYCIPQGTQIDIYNPMANAVYTDRECTQQITIDDIDTFQEEISIYIRQNTN